MSNLAVRVIFALCAAPLFLFLAWHGTLSRLVLLEILCAGSAWEFARMVRAKWNGPSLDFFAPVAVAVNVVLLASPWPLDFLWNAMVLAALVVVAFARVETEEIFPWIARQGAGIWFLGCWVAPSLWALFTAEPGWKGAGAFLFVSIAMWVADTGAYFSGRFFGRHKLCPGISPKKTVEGAVGGTVLTLAYALGVAPYWLPEVGWPEVPLLLGAVLAVSSIVGDLLESSVKRACGAKDSSHLFPGHGGVYDRFDSLFFSAPIAVAILDLLFLGRLAGALQ